MTYGVNSREQKSIVRIFLKSIFKGDIDLILNAVMNEYTDPMQYSGENKMVNRDTLLSIFSDARVAAPVLKAASLHAEAKEANQAKPAVPAKPAEPAKSAMQIQPSQASQANQSKPSQAWPKP